MYKEYFHDLFNEGLGDIFYLKYVNFIKKKVSNKSLSNLLIGIHKVVYILFLLVVAFIIFKLSFPL